MNTRRLAILTLALLLALLPGWNTASANESDQAFLQKYRDLYGYTDTTTQMYKPTFLNFVGFTRYLARDSGIADGMIYTLHGSVTPQRVEEYLTYLARFGYAITVDATQDGVRFVEVRNVGAPDMLPRNFRFYRKSSTRQYRRSLRNYLKPAALKKEATRTPGSDAFAKFSTP